MLLCLYLEERPASLDVECCSIDKFYHLHFPLATSFSLKEFAFRASPVITKNTQSPFCSLSDLYISLEVKRVLKPKPILAKKSLEKCNWDCHIQKLMMLVSLLFIKCFSVHFVWKFKVQCIVPKWMQHHRQELPWGMVNWWQPKRCGVIFISWKGSGLGRSHSLLPKSSGFKNQAAGPSPREVKIERSLAQRPDTGDNMNFIQISYN